MQINVAASIRFEATIILMDLKPISKIKFDALCFSKMPMSVLFTEVGWYEACDKLLAVIVEDTIDREHSFVILGRDLRRVFRAIQIQFCNGNKEDALKQLSDAVSQYKNDRCSYYEQEKNFPKPIDILKPIAAEDKLHRYFVRP